VLENVVRDDTKGTTEAVNAKYELMERGGYIPTGYKFDPVVLNLKVAIGILRSTERAPDCPIRRSRNLRERQL